MDPRFLDLPGCRIDLHTGTTQRADRPDVRLTSQETQLLARLARAAGKPVSREELLKDVWGYHTQVVSRAPDVAIRRLRTKIEVDPSQPQHVHTIRGEGWALHGVQEAMSPSEPSTDTQLLDLARSHTPAALTSLVLAIDDVVGDRLTSRARQTLLAHAQPTFEVSRRRALAAWFEGRLEGRAQLKRLQERAAEEGRAEDHRRATLELVVMGRAEPTPADPIDTLTRIARDATSAELRCATCIELARHHADRGSATQARTWLDEARAAHPTEALRLQLDNTAGHLAMCAGDAAEGLRILSAHLPRLGDDAASAWVWQTIGSLRFLQADLRGAHDAWESALFLARRLERWRQVASVVSKLGIVHAELGELDAAQLTFEEALGRSTDLQQHQTVASTQLNLGLLALMRGATTEARPWFEAGHHTATAQARHPPRRVAELGLAIADQLEGRAAADALQAIASEAAAEDDHRARVLALGHLAIERDVPELRNPELRDDRLEGVRPALEAWQRNEPAPHRNTVASRVWWAAAMALRGSEPP